MADPLSPDAFYASARDFAQRALQAHHAREFRRVALEAGTALEHLAKACLAKRSPALLSELRGDFGSLLRLLEIPGGKSLRELRTVSLRDALVRMRLFVVSTASNQDLDELVSLRDGTVHAAMDDEVEERLLVAFVQHADALLVDLGRHRDSFWAEYLPVVDALLAVASDKVAHTVSVKLAAARADFERQYGEMPEEVLDLLRRISEPLGYGDDRVPADCPVCKVLGIASGFHYVEWEPDWAKGKVVEGTVWFKAATFRCRVCGLRLDSPEELMAAGLDWRWEIEGADPDMYEPALDQESYYESLRESQREQEE